jgi:hypothetical protein
MATPSSPSSGRLFKAMLAAVVLYPLLSVWFLPAFVVPMRQRLARAMPSEWAAVVNDGSFQYASPYVLGNHLYEDGLIALRLRQVVLHGYPLDPYTCDKSLCSWVFGSVLTYTMAFFWLLAGGRPDAGMLLASGVTAAVKTYALYRLYEHVLRDRRAALFAAPFTLFFTDSMAAVFAELYGLVQSVAEGRLPGLGGLLTQLPRRVFNPMWVQDYARMPSVALSVLFTCGILTAAFRLATSGERRTGAALLAGLAVGAMGFVNFYEWPLSTATVACFFALSAFAGLPAAGRRNLAWMTAASAAASAAYGLWAWSFMRATRESIIYRAGDPVHFKPELLVYLAYAVWLFHRSRRDAALRPLWLLGCAVQCAVFLLCCSPLVIGFDLSFARHFHMQANLLMVVAALCAALARRPLSEWVPRHATVLLLLIAAWDVSANKSWAEKYFKLHGAPREIEDSMRWVDANTPAGSLLVTLSNPALLGVPRWTRARSLVTHYSPTVGHPCVTTRENLSRFATLLKTAGVDLETFLRERWLPFRAERDLDDALTFYSRNHALAQRERTDWPFFLMGEALSLPGVLEESAEQLRADFGRLPPLPPPFYLWLRDEERRFLAVPPEGRGARRVYAEGGVSVYEFR